jgi:hypothetical protein
MGIANRSAATLTGEEVDLALRLGLALLLVRAANGVAG